MAVRTSDAPAADVDTGRSNVTVMRHSAQSASQSAPPADRSRFVHFVATPSPPPDEVEQTAVVTTRRKWLKTTDSQAAALGLGIGAVIVLFAFALTKFGVVLFGPHDGTENIVIEIGNSTTAPADTSHQPASTPTAEPIVHADRDADVPGWWQCDAQVSSTERIHCD